MGAETEWTADLEVIIDTGRFGEVRVIRGDQVELVCREAEAYLRLVFEAGLSCSVEVNSPQIEHDRIQAQINVFAASYGKAGYPFMDVTRFLAQ
ncbi:hypothetical protein [Methylobacterium sp. 77]|uniref:hypothetical protein n=1 Tax=Methylobacterium sp. 77 TaxID=1101192 RepID=UPI000373E65F|nr:hypothetical protein [Methylobacterium sp. 77]